MKKLFYTLIICLAISSLSYAQDTLVHFNFEDELPMMLEFPDSPDSDEMWINWDEDQVADANPGTRFQNWYVELNFEPDDTTNMVFLSSSWLNGFDPNSSNWFISPAMEIVDDQATLSWESAPFQGPRYMDGYTVKVLTGSSDYNAADQVDVLFQVAEMAAITGDETSTSLSEFSFGDGYIHADGFTDSTYFAPPDSSFNQNTGLLEPHSVSLAAYAGQTVFIAFHHDSSDDNLFALDNVLMTGTAPTPSANKNIDELDVRFITYPNPVRNYLNVMYKLDETRTVGIEIFDIKGQLVKAIPYQKTNAGDYTEKLDLRHLVAGTYNVVLTVDDQKLTKQVIR